MQMQRQLSEQTKRFSCDSSKTSSKAVSTSHIRRVVQSQVPHLTMKMSGQSVSTLVFRTDIPHPTAGI